MVTVAGGMIMKRFLGGLVVGIVLASSALAWAANSGIRIIVDGQELVPDVPPVMVDGRVMVPLRAVADALGADVEWNSASQVVSISSRSGKGAEMMAEIDLSGWMQLKELSQQGVAITASTDGIVLSKGEVTVRWPATHQAPDSIVQATVEGGSIAAVDVLTHQYRTWLRIDQLQELGLLP